METNILHTNLPVETDSCHIAKKYYKFLTYYIILHVPVSTIIISNNNKKRKYKIFVDTKLISILKKYENQYITYSADKGSRYRYHPTDNRYIDMICVNRKIDISISMEEFDIYAHNTNFYTMVLFSSSPKLISELKMLFPIRNI